MKEKASTNAKKEKAVSSAKKKPVASKAKKEKAVASTKKAPVASKAKKEKTVASAKKEPVASKAKKEKAVASAKKEPVASKAKKGKAATKKDTAPDSALNLETPKINLIDSPCDTRELEEEIEALKEELGLLKKTQKKAIKRHKQEQELKPYQAQLVALQNYLDETNKRMVILFEGRDASGKGGTIRRVTRYMNEKRYHTVALGKPTSEQRSQWYFQRYVSRLPRGGEIVLFDRSWYNRAMVEPVLGFCTPEEHKNFMKGVVGFEKDLVRQGTILIKFYFSVTKSEQAKRFERRKTDPLRQWKLSEVDIQAQDYWDEFTNAKYDMLRRSHTSSAPWTIVRSNDKHAARLNVLKVILNSVPYTNRCNELDFVPNPEIVVSGSREIETMEVDRLNKGKFKA